MKWFFALNEECRTFNQYSELIRVAVISARRATQLEPFFIFDGKPSPLVRWLECQGVTILAWKSRFYRQLTELSLKSNNRDVLSIGAGAFLRVELPSIARHYRLEDEVVLYTDCDVMFLGDPVPDLSSNRCSSFAVAPEFDPKDFRKMNTGVMLMNLPALARDEENFYPFIERNIPKFVQSSWDQEAYRTFYGRRYFYQRDRWQRLPLSLNWKPYWGENAGAKIIHFHGPKPFMREQLTKGTLPEGLANLAKAPFWQSCQRWDEIAQLDPAPYV